jgi:hypothetical protein
MRTTLHVIAVLFLVASSFAQHRPVKKSLAAVPASEKHATVQFRNSDVTVRRFSIPPGESAAIGSSIHDYLVVAYGQSSLTVSGYQTNFEMNLTDGEIQVLQGGWPHTIKNQSQQTAEFIAVEVLQNISPKTALCGLGAKNCYQTRFGKSAQGEYQQALLFETDAAALYRAQLGPGVPMHQHGDSRKHLIIAITPIEGNLDEQTFSLQPGQTLWHPGNFDEIVNESSSDSTMLILELK